MIRKLSVDVQTAQRLYFGPPLRAMDPATKGAVVIPAVIERWHQIVKSRDVSGLDSLLADDVVFLSPVVHSPQVGKAVTSGYLRAALTVLNNESFRYLNQWYGTRSAVLEFATEIAGVQMNGVDIIEWNAEGRIIRFKVMVRPLKAINLLHQLMGQVLARSGAEHPAPEAGQLPQ